LAPCALDLLSHYRWPGNVRELENLMTRSTILHQEGQIQASVLRPWLAEQSLETGAESSNSEVSMDQMERQLIEATLSRFDGHRARTAEALGIGLRTLSGKLKSYGYAPRAKSFAAAG